MPPTRPIAFQRLLWAALLLAAACGAPSDTGSPDADRAAASAAAEAAAAIGALDPPADGGAFAPGMSPAAGGAHLVWIEPLDDGGHRLRYSRLEGATWRPAVEVVRGEGFFANWADTPSVVEDAAGGLYVHWLEKLGEGTYAYGVQLARSTDGGATWERLGLLHDDRSETEHGFVSLAAAGGGVQAVWLDGRVTAAGEPMQLRAVRLEGADVPPSTLVVESVCECCPTSMAVAAAGPVVAYRGRTAAEVRDIHLARLGPEGWLPPVTVGDDRWTIPGCPVNGPSVVSAGERVSVAWFTAAEGKPRVKAALSADGGASFGAPILIDGEKPIGRVAAAPGAGDGVAAWVAWVAAGAGDGEAEIRLARVGTDGTVAAVRTIASTSTSRRSGMPRLVRDGDRLLLAWVEATDPPRLHLSTVQVG